MKADRYLRVLLTIIAVELGWIAIDRGLEPVSAQAAATPVVITGINIRDERAFLPVGVMGGHQRIPAGVPLTQVRVAAEFPRPVAVDVREPLDVRHVGAVRVEPGDRPIRIESVYQPAQRPGE